MEREKALHTAGLPAVCAAKMFFVLAAAAAAARAEKPANRLTAA